MYWVIQNDLDYGMSFCIATESMETARDGGVRIGTHSIDSDISVEDYDFYYETVNKLDQQG